MFKWIDGKPTGIAKNCDCIIINLTKTIFNKSPEDIKTVFVNTRIKHKAILIFRKLLNNELKNTKDLIVIIAGEDWTFPNSVDKRMHDTPKKHIKVYYNLIKHPNVKTFFIENLDCYMAPHVHSFPLGFNPKESTLDINYFLNFENKNFDRPLKFTSFNRGRSKVGEWATRGNVEKLCKTNKWKKFYIHTGLLHHTKFLETMAKYTFTLAVNGGGIDPNPKIFEAILLGTIPIIVKREPYTDSYKDMPVIVLDEEWNEHTFTEEKLKKWYDKCKPYLEDGNEREKVLEKLTLEYWWNVIISDSHT